MCSIVRSLSSGKYPCFRDGVEGTKESTRSDREVLEVSQDRFDGDRSRNCLRGLLRLLAALLDGLLRPSGLKAELVVFTLLITPQDVVPLPAREPSEGSKSSFLSFSLSPLLMFRSLPWDPMASAFDKGPLRRNTYLRGDS